MEFKMSWLKLLIYSFSFYFILLLALGVIPILSFEHRLVDVLALASIGATFSTFIFRSSYKISIQPGIVVFHYFPWRKKTITGPSDISPLEKRFFFLPVVNLNTEGVVFTYPMVFWNNATVTSKVQSYLLGNN